MAAKSRSKKRSASGLMSEAAKKAARGIKDAAKQAVGKQRARGSKSPTGNLSEAAKKAGRAIGDTAKRAVGMRPSRVKKSGSK